MKKSYALSGFLTKEEMNILRNLRNRPTSKLRKSMINKWICRDCEHSVYYKIKRCIECESTSIKQVIAPTAYMIEREITTPQEVVEDA